MRKWLNWTVKGVLWLILTCVVLVALPFLVALLPAGRALMLEQGLAQANKHLPWNLTATSLDRLDPWGVELRGFAMYAKPEKPQNKLSDPIARVGHVAVELDPLALIHNKVRLRRVSVSHVYANVDRLLSSLPLTPEVPAEPEPPSDEPGLNYQVDDLSLRNVYVDLTVDGRRLATHLEQLRAAGRYGERTSVVLSALDVAARDQDGEFARISTQTGGFDLDIGGHVALTGKIARTELELHARVGALPDDASFPEGKVHLTVRGLTRDTLERVGVSGVALARPLDITLDAESNDTSTLALRVKSGARALLTVDAKAGLDGVHVKDGEVSVEVHETKLSDVMTDLPEQAVAAKVRATYDGSFTEGAYSVAWNAVRFDGNDIPDGSLRGSLAETSAQIDALRIKNLERALSLKARYDFPKELVDAELKLLPTRFEDIPWLNQAGLSGLASADIAFRGGARGKLQGKVALIVDQLRAGDVTLARADVDLKLAGTSEQPLIAGHAAMRTLVADPLRVDEAGFDIDMRNGNADVAFRLLADQARLTGEVRARKVNAKQSIDGRAFGTLHDSVLALTFQGELPETGSQRARLNLELGGQTLALTAEKAPNDRLQAALDARNVDLSYWGAFLQQEGISGKIDLTAHASGPLSKPNVEAQVSLRDVQGFGQPATDAVVDARADLGARRYAVKLEARGKTDSLLANVAANIVLPAQAKTTIDWLKGPYDVHARVHVPAQRLATLDEERLAPLRGAADVWLEANGENRELDAHLRLAANMRLPTAETTRGDRLEATVDVTHESAALRLEARDGDGELLNAQGRVNWPHGSLFAATNSEAWQALPPFELALRLAERRIDQMQGVFAYFAGLYQLSMPIKVSAKVNLEGEGDDLSGNVAGRVLVMSDALDPSCKLGTLIRSDFDVSLEDQTVLATVTAREQGGGVVRVEARQALNLKSRAGSQELLGPSQVSVNGRDITLRNLPGFCQLEGGRAALTAQATAVLGHEPATASLELGLEDLRAGRNAEPVGLHMTAGLTPKFIAAEGELNVRGQRSGGFSARVPIALHAETKLPEIGPETPVTASLKLDKLPVAPFLSIGDVLGRPSGHLSARVKVEGPLNNPRPDGYVEFEKVSFSLASSAQPLRDINGRVEVHGRSIEIKNLTAHDLDGDLKLNGKATLGEDGTGYGKLTLETDELPLRRQGEIVGELSLKAVVEARIPPSQKAEVNVDVRGGRIWLTGDTGRDVQSLDANEDVVFVDVPVAEREEEKKEEEPGPDAFGLAFVTIKSAEREIWLMHEDFALQVGLDLKLVMEDQAILRGKVELKRGEVTLLGKLFSLDQGAIRFVGDTPPDPELDIRLVHELPSGGDLIVTLTGRGTAPVLEFSGAATNVGEAVALLTGGGRSGSESSAQDDARNFATNLTAGLLTVAARREFGDWVPVLGVESDATGAVSGARAGFDATKLIPKALRGFARAAYVEGIVGSNRAEGGNVGVGVKLEVVLPRDIVTSWGYGPGTTWSTDVAWVP